MKKLFFIVLFLFSICFVSSSGCVGKTTTFFCGDIINESCTLNGDISFGGNSDDGNYADTCFRVSTFSLEGFLGGGSSSEIVLDCAGNSIVGYGEGYGIRFDSSGILKNCRISNFDYSLETAGKVSLVNNTFYDSQVGVRIFGEINGAVFENNSFIDNSQAGLVLYNAIGGVFKNNKFLRNGGSGMYLNSDSESSFFGNVFSNNYHEGVYLEFSDSVVFINNEFSFNKGGGIFIQSSDFLGFEDNLVLNNSGIGVSLESAENAILKNNQIKLNGFSFSYSYEGAGINSIGSPHAYFENNVICDNRGKDLYFFANSFNTTEIKNTCDSRGVFTNDYEESEFWSEEEIKMGCDFQCSEVKGSEVKNSVISNSDLVGCVGSTKTFVCGEKVNENCTLNGDLNAKKNCFSVSSNDITINCAGHTISGNKADGFFGIGANGINNFNLINCNLENFYFGVYFENSSNINLEKNSFCSNKMKDIYVENTQYFGKENACSTSFGWSEEGKEGCSLSCKIFSSKTNSSRRLFFVIGSVGFLIVLGGVSFYIFRKFFGRNSSLVENSNTSF